MGYVRVQVLAACNRLPKASRRNVRVVDLSACSFPARQTAAVYFNRQLYCFSFCVESFWLVVNEYG